MCRPIVLLVSMIIPICFSYQTQVSTSENKSAPIQRPPNIVIILCDDLGFSDIGCYGSEIATPNLDQLAASGRRFTHFYNTARCWPTRASLLTGYYAQQVRRDHVEGIPSGSQGKRPAWAKLLPERLKAHGYRSYHSGKWHIDGLPTASGFDRSYSLQDHDRHFHPKQHTWDDQPVPPVGLADGYYSSTEITNRMLTQWDEHAREHSQTPFFAYIAFTAPHFPLQAPKPIVDRYLSRYHEGWDAIRASRWNRMSHLGLGTHPAPIEPEVGPPYHFPKALEQLGPGEINRPVPWSALTEEQRIFQSQKMAVHAAMIEVMDAEIGRLIRWLKDHQQLEDTLILFLSDNGASAEIMVRGDGHDPLASPGGPDTFLCLGPGWSSACNTPFRRHKTWVHEGGICTPFIAHWPASIAARPEPIETPLHVIDIVPTLLDCVAQSEGNANPNPFTPGAPGTSFAELLTTEHNSDATSHSRDAFAERCLWWQHEGNRAIRIGDWKLVASGRDAPWELYNLRAERVETKDLAAEHPDRVLELANRWEEIRLSNQVMAANGD